MRERKNHTPLRGMGCKITTLEYRGKRYKCFLATGYMGWPEWIIPESLNKAATIPGIKKYNADFKEFLNGKGATSVPDEEFESIKRLRQYLADINPYEYAEDWDGIIPVISLKELNNA